MWVGVSTQPPLLPWNFCFAPCLPALSRPLELGPWPLDPCAALMRWAVWLLSPRRSPTREPVCGGFDLLPRWSRPRSLSEDQGCDSTTWNSTTFLLLTVQQLRFIQCEQKSWAWPRFLDMWNIPQTQGRKLNTSWCWSNRWQQTAAHSGRSGQFSPSSDWLMMAGWMFSACLQHLLWIKRWTITQLPEKDIVGAAHRLRWVFWGLVEIQTTVCDHVFLSVLSLKEETNCFSERRRVRILDLCWSSSLTVWWLALKECLNKQTLHLCCEQTSFIRCVTQKTTAMFYWSTVVTCYSTFIVHFDDLTKGILKVVDTNAIHHLSHIAVLCIIEYLLQGSLLLKWWVHTLSYSICLLLTFSYI